MGFNSGFKGLITCPYHIDMYSVYLTDTVQIFDDSFLLSCPCNTEASNGCACWCKHSWWWICLVRRQDKKKVRIKYKTQPAGFPVKCAKLDLNSM